MSEHTFNIRLTVADDEGSTLSKGKLMDRSLTAIETGLGGAFPAWTEDSEGNEFAVRLVDWRLV